MKLQVLCDLHVEFGDMVVPDVGADVVVLAGDTHVKERGLQWIFDQGFKVPVVYVLGNHEFYGDKFPGLIDKLKRDAEGTNVHVLENEWVEVDGFKFFGCTLWSDMALLGDQRAATIFAEQAMNDYRLIRHSKTFRRLSPNDTKAQHSESIRKLRWFFETGHPERSVVVTHHAPSIRSVPERYRTDPVSPAFASNLDELILKHQPRLWIHGHTHESFDYRIGKTRIICNPRGYVPQADNPDFDPYFSVQM